MKRVENVSVNLVSQYLGSIRQKEFKKFPVTIFFIKSVLFEEENKTHLYGLTPFRRVLFSFF